MKQRRARRLLLGFLILAVAATVVGLLLQGAYVGGFGLSAAFKWTVLQSVLHTNFGIAWSVRLLALVLAGAFMWALSKHEVSDLTVRGAGIGIALAAIVPTAFAGHALAGSMVLLTVAATIVHLVAAALWVGGLALVLTSVLPSSQELGAEGDTVVHRYSQVAFGAVVAIVISGVIQTWRLVGSVKALTTTTHGVLLCIKVAVFFVLLVVAAQSRKWVRRKTEERGGLRRLVQFEAGLAVLVLGITALLVNAQPGVKEVVDPYSAQLVGKKVIYLVEVDPPKEGPTSMHFYALNPSGTTIDVDDFKARLQLPAKDIGPLEVPLTELGTGHWTSSAFSFPLDGTWTLEMSGRIGELDSETLTTEVKVK